MSKRVGVSKINHQKKHGGQNFHASNSCMQHTNNERLPAGCGIRTALRKNCSKPRCLRPWFELIQVWFLLIWKVFWYQDVNRSKKEGYSQKKACVTRKSLFRRRKRGNLSRKVFLAWTLWLIAVCHSVSQCMRHISNNTCPLCVTVHEANWDWWGGWLARWHTSTCGVQELTTETYRQKCRKRC